MPLCKEQVLPKNKPDSSTFDCGCDGLEGVELQLDDQITLAIDEADTSVKISRRKAIAYLGGFLLLAACGAPEATPGAQEVGQAATAAPNEF
jgi:hypothetical protein